MGPAVAEKTAPCGAVIAPVWLGLSDLEAEVLSLRYCPPGEALDRARVIARRIVAAEARVWELTKAVRP